LYYADGVYRYFLINESDKNKFAVGDYVIFKADSDGPTYSNKKYKILEFEAKPKNFLDNNEISGLYFKIQDEDADFSSSSLVVSESQGIGSNDITNLNTCNKGSKNAIEQGSESGRYAEDPIETTR
jgi:hypothetical protein